jgi:hypothetical protein
MPYHFPRVFTHFVKDYYWNLTVHLNMKTDLNDIVTIMRMLWNVLDTRKLVEVLLTFVGSRYQTPACIAMPVSRNGREEWGL